MNFFTEQDNKNRPLQQSLGQPQRDVMFNVGDSLNQAYFTGATVEEFNTNTIFYRRLDSIVDGFVYS